MNDRGNQMFIQANVDWV